MDRGQPGDRRAPHLRPRHLRPARRPQRRPPLRRTRGGAAAGGGRRARPEPARTRSAPAGRHPPAGEAGGLPAQQDGASRSLPSGRTLRIEINGINSDRLPPVLDLPRHDLPDLHLLQPRLAGPPVTKDASLRIGRPAGTRCRLQGSTRQVDQVYAGVVERRPTGDHRPAVRRKDRHRPGRPGHSSSSCCGPGRSGRVGPGGGDGPPAVVERVPTHVGRSGGAEPRPDGGSTICRPRPAGRVAHGQRRVGRTFLALAAGLNWCWSSGATAGCPSTGRWCRWAARRSDTSPGT